MLDWRGLFGDKSFDLVFEDGKNYKVWVTNEINGFLIFYPEISFKDYKLEDTDITSLLKRISDVMKNFGIKASHFLLEIWPEEFGGGGACNVDKQRTIHLILPAKLRNGHLIVPSRGNGKDYLLYHELMHAKDILEGRSISSGILDIVEDFNKYLRGVADNFSVEGRLEKMDLPHYSREQIKDIAKECVIDDVFRMGFKQEEIEQLLQKKFFERLCDKVWGQKLTSAEIDGIIKEMLG